MAGSASTGSTISAAMRYPLANTARAHDRRIENWANNGTAVIKIGHEHRRGISPNEGIDPPRLEGRERPNRDEKGEDQAITPARASRLCARLGDKAERMKRCSSGAAAAVFAIGAHLAGGLRLAASCSDEPHRLSFAMGHHSPRLSGAPWSIDKLWRTRHTRHAWK
jgi:hypothetical protein